MAVIPSWLNPPDFIGAARSGAQIGLSEAEMHQQAEEHAAELALKRDELAASMSQSAAERGQRGREQNAALALRQAALQQQGLLGQGRIDNQANEISARDALEKEKLDAASKKGVFVNTGNGLFQRDSITGEWSKVPDTSRPSAQKFESVPTYIPPVPAVEGQPADVTTHGIYNLFHSQDLPPTTNSPAISEKAAVPGHWYQKRVPITSTETNAADDLKSFGAPIKGAAFETNPVVPITDPLTPKYTKGQRAVQDGKTYEFDGTTWNEVNQ